METTMTIKKTKLAGMLAAALSVAAPLAIAASPADAAPMRGEMMMAPEHRPAAQVDNYRDRDHRPQLRIEYRPIAPRGHFHWHAGAWSWGRGHWVWVPGGYVRF
jgi:hypothetical protein